MRSWLVTAGLLAGCATSGPYPDDVDDDAASAPLDAAADSFVHDDPNVDAAGPPADGPGLPDAAPPDARPCVGGAAAMVDPTTGHCYLRFDSGRSWTEADTACVALAAHLVTSNDLPENDFVRALVGSSNVWIGASDREAEGTWHWLTGEHWSFTHWDGGQPDNGSGSEDCGMLLGGDGGRWNDDQCGNNHRYVCERD